ncbi:MAG: hypothetical protein RMM28_02590 [Thermoleophilia bacterium]|nr:hypothetical protein [Thermoleophilia bacterium]
MSRVRRIAEEEYIVVVLLAGFAVCFLLIFPPFLLVADSWMNLVAGREIWERGLPRTEELTVYGAGATWTAQQWLAHLLFYGTHALGGHALLVLLAAGVVLGAFAIAAAAARSLGAGPRAIWALFVPVLLAAPWAWSIRAQMLALPLYTALVWLLLSEARAPTRRVWLAAPLLLLWGQLHGSVVLGALLVSALGVTELVLSRGSSWRRSAWLVALPPLAVLVTPYGPFTTARYYHLLLIEPPFAGVVTEWQWPNPAKNTMFFYVLVAIAIPIVWYGRRRLTAFDFVLLALSFAGAITAIRGVIWFAMACMVLLPVAIGRSLESRSSQAPRRRLNRGIALACAAAVLGTAAHSLARDPSWYTSRWPSAPLETVRAELGADDRLLADSSYADWLLWELPELRGRLAYDVRFELYDRTFFDRLARYSAQDGEDWLSFADGYEIVLVDETRRSATDRLLAETGARLAYRDDALSVVIRRGGR